MRKPNLCGRLYYLHANNVGKDYGLSPTDKCRPPYCGGCAAENRECVNGICDSCLPGYSDVCVRGIYITADKHICKYMYLTECN